MGKKEDLPNWCEVVPELRISAKEKEQVLREAMKYADSATKRDIQKAIERIKT